MGRSKTIADDEILRVARAVFRHHGHAASTRAIADAAGISEAILYQRFGTKDDLFFAAMRPQGPDIEQLLGPADPAGPALPYLRRTAARLGRHFAAVIPEAIHVMMHPSFEPGALRRAELRGSVSLHDALRSRLESLRRRHLIRVESASTAARLILSLAHDWGLGHAMAHGEKPVSVRQLTDMVDLMWKGIRRAKA